MTDNFGVRDFVQCQRSMFSTTKVVEAFANLELLYNLRSLQEMTLLRTTFILGKEVSVA